MNAFGRVEVVPNVVEVKFRISKYHYHIKKSFLRQKSSEDIIRNIIRMLDYNKLAIFNVNVFSLNLCM
jgi:hypothetical protein